MIPVARAPLSALLALAALSASPLATPTAQAEDALSLHALVSNGMVLQRESVVPLSGHGRPGAAVVVTPSWEARPTRALVEGDGTWRLRIATPAAGGPHTLAFSMDEEHVSVEDVLVGEVWLASGQSNMEWKIAWMAAGIEDYEAAVAAADHPTIRVFDVPNRTSRSPEPECDGSWAAITPATWPNVSAVGFYFAKELSDALGVPIGLITSEWGGTVCEAWTGEETLRADFPEFDGALDRIAAAHANAGGEDSLATLQASWWEALAKKDPGSAEGWQRPAVDDAAWSKMTLPAAWESAGLEYDGVVWFRRTLTLPERLAGRALVLELGAIDDMDTAWFDGQRVGGTEVDGAWQAQRRYAIPAALAKAGEHTLAVRAVDTGGAGGMTGPADALRIVAAERTDIAPLELEGAWRYQTGASMGTLGAWPRQSGFGPNEPTALFNGMIAPLVGYGMRGAIWYQGESNRTRAAQYERLFPAMITDWRTRWGRGDFPFLFVQIAPYDYDRDTGQAAELRDAQRKTLALANTGMAVTLDIGNPADIHPVKKQAVGRRLALWARARTYGEEGLEVSGPLYRALSVENGKARVTFDHAAGGLVAQGGALTHIQLAGADRVFHPATAEIDGESLLVSSPAVAAPVAVRFAWGATDEPNLFNRAGLPASSFRTDDWPPE